VSAAAFFLGCIHNKVVPLLLSGNIDSDMLKRYVEIYKPNYIYKSGDNTLTKHNSEINTLNPELSLLLPTSGTTGSPKLVRHSYRNLAVSAANVARAFDLNEKEFAMLQLPIYFTQGLSVLCSHIHAGAAVYLTDDALSSREFWDAMKSAGITSFTGVTYSYEVLDKLRFYTMKLPSLTSVSQGGGRLTNVLWDRLAAYANETGRNFYATYGASETTARMSMLRPEYVQTKRCSIGKPLDGYTMHLEDDNNQIITAPNQPGELVFKGESVTLGYAECLEDLALGDERGGIYRTSDIAYRDEDGFYYITGRLARFIKLFGLRINLDETERLIKMQFGSSFACAGNDEKLCVFTTDKDRDGKEVELFLKEKLKINISAFKLIFIDEIPKNEYGKTSYGKLNEMIGE
jgi:acyl-coenzyme A synthetase/AMP-(fatty) acid ligase